MNNVKGELTVVVELGLTTDIEDIALPSDSKLVDELVHITENNRSSRRKALSILARRHHMTPNEVYDAIERVKKLAK
jgi:hypothetical protein